MHELTSVLLTPSAPPPSPSSLPCSLALPSPDTFIGFQHLELHDLQYCVDHSQISVSLCVNVCVWECVCVDLAVCVNVFVLI